MQCSFQKLLFFFYFKLADSKIKKNDIANKTNTIGIVRSSFAHFQSMVNNVYMFHFFFFSSFLLKHPRLWTMVIFFSRLFFCFWLKNTNKITNEVWKSNRFNKTIVWMCCSTKFVLMMPVKFLSFCVSIFVCDKVLSVILMISDLYALLNFFWVAHKHIQSLILV